MSTKDRRATAKDLRAWADVLGRRKAFDGSARRALARDLLRAAEMFEADQNALDQLLATSYFEFGDFDDHRP